MAGVTPVVVTVTQAAAPCTLTVTPSNQNVAYSPAGSTNFAVTSNCAWTAVSNQTWCTVTLSGTGNGTIIASYGVNSTTSSRTASITVTVSGVTPITVTVTQSGQPGCTPPWQPVTNQQFNMNVIAKLYISNVLTTNAADAIGAFVGTECRGIGYPTPSLNGIIFLTITSNVQSGETITFKAWKSATCEECPVGETMPFVNQSEVGTMGSPFEFHCGIVPLSINFGAGYTWFSVNVNPGSLALNSLFSTLTPAENDRIIGQQSFATYYGTQWVGSLSTIDPTAMYKMKKTTQQLWTIQGSPVAITPITVAGGATSYPWIGYLPQTELPTSTALAGLVPGPASNDRFNGQSSFATYSGTSWVGTLATLQKGKGYIIHLANTSVLTYPTGLDNPEIAIVTPPVATVSPTGEVPNSTPRFNMQIIGSIILPDGSYSNDASDVVYAYVGNE